MNHKFSDAANSSASRHLRSSVLIRLRPRTPAGQVCGFIFFLLSASFSQASSNLVSRPAGVMVFNLPQQSQSLISMPYRPHDLSLDSVIGDQLKTSTNSSSSDAILLWDKVNLRYRSLSRVNGRWQDDSSGSEVSDVELEAGSAFWVLNRQWTNEVLMLGGQVLFDDTNSVILSPSLNLIGLPYSSALSLEKSGLSPLGSDRLVDGDGNSVSNMVPGKGYWFDRKEQNSRLWVETRPYDNIFTEAGTPSITGIRIGSGKEAILTIGCEVLPAGAKLDIYYKDARLGEALDLEKNWVIAESDIPVGGPAIEWYDSGNSSRKPVNEVFARYYLVGRSDIVGCDNIPLSRARLVYGTAASDNSGSVAAAHRAASSITSGRSTNSSSSAGLVSSVVNSSASISRIIYVDSRRGDDGFSGFSRMAAEGNGGPKRSVNGALRIAGAGSVISVNEGVYVEKVRLFGVKLITTGKVIIREYGN